MRINWPRVTNNHESLPTMLKSEYDVEMENADDDMAVRIHTSYYLLFLFFDVL